MDEQASEQLQWSIDKLTVTTEQVEQKLADQIKLMQNIITNQKKIIKKMMIIKTIIIITIAKKIAI